MIQRPFDRRWSFTQTGVTTGTISIPRWRDSRRCRQQRVKTCMEVTREPKKQRDLATRIFAKPYFAISWVAFLGSMFLLVGWPMRNIVLVCWVYGPDGYFDRGIRV